GIPALGAEDHRGAGVIRGGADCQLVRSDQRAIDRGGRISLREPRLPRLDSAGPELGGRRGLRARAGSRRVGRIAPRSDFPDASGDATEAHPRDTRKQKPMIVLIADRFPEGGQAALAQAGVELAYDPELKDAALAEAVRSTGADVLVVRSTKVPAATLTA